MNRERPYRVCDYSFEELRAFFSVGNNVVCDEHGSNCVVDYFEDYFVDLKSKTIVLESRYTDSDYLDDYTAYYARCFTDFNKRTRRIHFFDHYFTQEAFEECLSGQNPGLRDLLECPKSKHYLGFIVIRPLPRTFVGRTCLRTSTDNEGARSYPVTRTYHANLFGIRLSLETLAFQEQDHEVAACATSALWSLFHGSSVRFGHSVPSPSAITSIATSSIPDWLKANPDTRRFPNSGLSTAQICAAIRSVGLEAFLIGALKLGDEETSTRKDNHSKRAGQRSIDGLSKRANINGAAYAYLSAGIPILMVCSLKEPKRAAETTAGIQKKLEGETCVDRGFHAVTLTGYSLENGLSSVTHKQYSIALRAMRIDKLYAHDDQIGPFAEMAWRDDDRSLDTKWYKSAGRTIYAVPDCLIVPLTPKIRIPYETIEESVFQLDPRLGEFSSSGYPAGKQVEWEIRLVTVNVLKSEIIDDSSISMEERIRLLSLDLPKHLWLAAGWVADTYYPAKKQIEFIVDATALKQEGGLIDAIIRDTYLPSALGSSLKNVKIPDAENATIQVSSLTRQIYSYLIAFA
jgi:hypothetical protein